LTCSSCNRGCFLPHDIKKRAAVPSALRSVTSSTHFTTDRMYLEYGGEEMVGSKGFFLIVLFCMMTVEVGETS